MEESERQASKKPPWQHGQDLEQGSFGTWLRNQREARGIELREIADHTKIGIRYLEALEKDRFDLLPAPVFTKGFLSQYGRFIGLDPDQVVNTYLNALQEGDPNTEEPGRGSAGARSFKAGLVVVGVLAILGLAGYLTLWKGRSQGTRDDQRPPMVAPAVRPPDPILSTPEPEVDRSAVVAPLVVTLDFVDDSWLETVVDDDRQLSEQIGKGESRRILAQERITLSLGNFTGVRVEVNGMPYALPPPVESGGMAEFEINLETALRLADEAGS